MADVQKAIEGDVGLTALVTLVLLMVIAAGICALRRKAGVAVPRTRTGAIAALASIQDWSKWMSAILTGVLGALALVFFEKDSWVPRHLLPSQTYLAVSAFLFLAAALVCSSLVLCALPAHSLRVHSIVAGESELMPHFDVYAQPLYVGTSFLQLGDVLVLKHVYWFLGLLAFTGVLYTQVTGGAT